MTMKNSDMIAGLVDEFYEKMQISKEAADSTNPSAPGDKDKKSPQGHTTQESPTQKSRGAEMQQDLEDKETGAVKGDAVLASTDAAQVKEGDAYEHPQEDEQNPKELDADEAPQQAGDNFKVKESTQNMAAPSEIAKVARAERLGSAICRHIASLDIHKEAAANAEAASEAQPDSASVDAYMQFDAGFRRGMEKKAQDMQEVVASGLAPSEDEAAALLDGVALEDPEAVLPEEAQPEAVLDEETMAVVDELAETMAAEGITPEDLAEAVTAVEELQAQGVPPEMIAEAVAEMGAEAEAAPEAAAAPETEVAPEVALEKTAEENRQIVRQRLAKFFEEKE